MEEDWELVDIIGKYSAWALAPSTNTLIYSIGSQLILWNLDTDQKFHLRCHNNMVSGILFSLSGEFFISAEISSDPFMCLWRFEDLSQKSVKFLPSKLRKSSLAKIDLALFESTLLVLEVEKDSGYKVSRWNWQEAELDFIDSQVLEIKEKAGKARWINSEFFFTSETTFIKVWNNAKSVNLDKRLYFKSEIKDVEYSAELGAFALLLGNFQFLIVNLVGQILNNFTEQYSAFTLTSEYLFLAGASLQVFMLRNYSLVSEMQKAESRVEEILVNGGNLACVKYENSTLNVVDLEKDFVVKTVAYHGTKIHSLVWSLDGNFVTGGTETSVYFWSKQDSGWGLEAIQLSNEEVTSLSLNNEILAVGFASGYIRTYTQDFDQLSSYRAHYSKVFHLSLTRSSILISQYESGPLLLLDSTYTRTAGTLQDSKHPINKAFSYCELSDSNETLLLIGSLQDCKTIAIHRVSKKDSVKMIGFSNLQLESKCVDFKVHTSGKYLIAALDLGSICLYEIFSCNLVGVINNSGSIVIDHSGLYLACMVQDDASRVVVYEVGTGEIAAEMGRIATGQQVYFSFDGKLVAITGENGEIEVWRLPEVVRFNVEKMLSRADEDVWDKFPILYQNTTIRKKLVNAKIPGEALVNNKAFTETVVSLVNKPERKADDGLRELPRFKAPDVVVSKFFDRKEDGEVEVEAFGSEGKSRTRKNDGGVKKLYLNVDTQETVSFAPSSKLSFVRKPQEFRSTGIVDSPVSLSSYKKKSENAGKGKVADAPISFSKPKVVSKRDTGLNPFYISK